MKTKPKKRNRAAQDSTLINLRALKKRVATLEKSTKTLRETINMQTKAISHICVVTGIGFSIKRFK